MSSTTAFLSSVPISPSFPVQRTASSSLPISPAPTLPSRLRPRRPLRHMAPSLSARPPVQVPDALRSLRVVGLGGCGIDMIAQVSSFPVPDDKLRTQSAFHTGGGNTANTLTAIRRLGLPASLVTKIGDDANGARVLAELTRDGVDVSSVVSSARTPTPFTYVIVDAATASRTCIHTPADEELLPADVAGKEDRLLAGATLLVLDSRHTLAAVALARAANARGVPVLLDVERERPGLDELLPLADYIVAAKAYPQSAEPAASGRVDAMTRLLLRSGGRARAVICTAGEAGATLVTRVEDDARERGVRDKELVVTRERIAATAVGRYGAGKSRAAATATGRRDGGGSRAEGETDEDGEVVVLQCPAWPVKDVVDTCGAGDAFIGGVAYGIAVGLSVEGWLGLGTRVAARQIGKLGARAGLPRRDELDITLLTPMPRL